jgi:hypothetical protein
MQRAITPFTNSHLPQVSVEFASESSTFMQFVKPDWGPQMEQLALSAPEGLELNLLMHDPMVSYCCVSTCNRTPKVLAFVSEEVINDVLAAPLAYRNRGQV